MGISPLISEGVLKLMLADVLVRKRFSQPLFEVILKLRLCRGKAFIWGYTKTTGKKTAHLFYQLYLAFPYPTVLHIFY